MVMVLLVLFCWWRQCFFVFVFDIGGGADGCGGVGGGSGCVSSGWLREGGRVSALSAKFSLINKNLENFLF